MNGVVLWVGSWCLLFSHICYTLIVIALLVLFIMDSAICLLFISIGAYSSLLAHTFVLVPRLFGKTYGGQMDNE